MHLSQTDIETLRDFVEHQGGFQIAIVSMQPATFLNVKMASEALYQKLSNAGLAVLLDDLDRRPSEKFAVVEFLQIEHRIVISSRSISAGVYEYKNLVTDEFVKVPESEALEFLVNKLI